MKKLYKNKKTGGIVGAVQWTLPVWDAHDEVCELLGTDKGLCVSGGHLWIADVPGKYKVDTEQLRLDAPTVFANRACKDVTTGKMIVFDNVTVEVVDADDFYTKHERYFPE